MILGQTVLKILEGLISCRTNERTNMTEAYHIRQKRGAGPVAKRLTYDLNRGFCEVKSLVLERQKLKQKIYCPD